MSRYDRNGGGGSLPSQRGRPEDGGGGGYSNFGGGNFGGGGNIGGAGGRGYLEEKVGTLKRHDVEEELQRVDPNQRPNNILLITILNDTYPINVATLHRVCSPHGRVLRIVIFRKDQKLQAMVEYPDVETAIKAKFNLHGKLAVLVPVPAYL